MTLKIKEKEIEDFICENPQSLFYYEEAIIIGRQVRLPHGVLDILAWTGRATAIVELKATPLQEKDVGQLLRYVYDVKKLLQYAQLNLLSERHATEEHRTRTDQLYVDRYLEFCGILPEDERHIEVKLIGNSGKPTALAAAQGADIAAYEWKLDESSGGFTFERIYSDVFPEYHATPKWAKTICRLSDEHTKEWADTRFESEIYKLFASVPNFKGVK